VGTGYRTSFAEWRAGVDPRWKALAQNGAGLGVGWYLGVPQWIARETAYLVQHCDGWTDSMALTGYVPAVIILWFDRRTHRARGFLAYPARALTVCLIVGVFCQGIAQHL
jgi:hypothetical protein